MSEKKPPPCICGGTPEAHFAPMAVVIACPSCGRSGQPKLHLDEAVASWEALQAEATRALDAIFGPTIPRGAGEPLQTGNYPLAGPPGSFKAFARPFADGAEIMHPWNRREGEGSADE